LLSDYSIANQLSFFTPFIQEFLFLFSAADNGGSYCSRLSCNALSLRLPPFPAPGLSADAAAKKLAIDSEKV